jgi:hypothetical protein
MEGKEKIGGKAKKRRSRAVVAASGYESGKAWDRGKENEGTCELD